LSAIYTNMFTEKHYLEKIDGNQLDSYLERGWYRMGQSVFTCRFLIFNDELFSAVWIRLPLEGFTFSKKKRKQMRALDRRFRTVVRPFEMSLEKERLYVLYKQNFPAKIAPTLSASLFDGTDNNIFNTYEVSIYDGDQLIAYSTFDLGQQSLASILGIYHPDYARYSLGFYTMLKEMEFGQENGFRYYYPGYVVPGYPKFNYKLRIGPVEFFREESHQWLPYDTIDHQQLPNQVMHSKLLEFQQIADSRELESNLFLYPPYEANLLGYWILDYLDYPLILQLQLREDSEHQIILGYDYRQGLYLLYLCTVYDNLKDFFLPLMEKGPTKIPLKFELLIKEKLVMKSADPQMILQQLEGFTPDY
jgi:arginyl-tRNA--protein-N-Asp/Glu arginylyltransferase